MKIYTKKGDQGKTYLFGGGPFPKNDARIDTYGEIDELNSAMGCARAFIQEQELATQLQTIQESLFTIGSELSTVSADEKLKLSFLQEAPVVQLEHWIDAFDVRLKPLKNFILPGGSQGASFLHLARTVCRRAERKLVALSEKQTVRPVLIKYLNRLSDYLFVAARVVNQQAKQEDILWKGLV